MKKIIVLALSFASFVFTTSAQELTAKEKGETLAKNEFSKTKHKKKERFGVVKEMHRVIESTPVATNDLSFYHGNYVYEDLQYKIEIRTDAQKKLMATLKIGDAPPVDLKDVSIDEAFFRAEKQNADGTQELWEGVFINKNDNGNTEFGLGIKLAKPMQLNEGLHLTKIFLKKVSP